MCILPGHKCQCGITTEYQDGVASELDEWLGCQVSMCPKVWILERQGGSRVRCCRHPEVQNDCRSDCMVCGLTEGPICICVSAHVVRGEQGART